MKNKILPILAVFVLLASSLACGLNVGSISSGNSIGGSGKVVTQTRDVSNISSVEIALPGTLHITMGDQEALTIEAEDNLMDYIETNVTLGRLVIETKSGYNIQPTRPINYDLTVTKLSAITISSSGGVDTGDLNSDTFSITISSSGSLSISSMKCSSLQVKSSSSGNAIIGNLAADTISLTLSSSGNVEIQNGQVPQQDIRLSSSGEYKANNLASTSAVVRISSSGSATIRVSDQLTGTLNSSGNVYYIGNPTVNISSSSSGKAIPVSQ
jgi:Putative auto-transporter adhesin, head GIN domain